MLTAALVLAARLAEPEARAFEGEPAVVAGPEDATATVESPAPSAPDPAPVPSTVTPASEPAATEPPRAAPAPADAPKRRKRQIPFPPLVLAGGPVLGPHAFGNEECRSAEARCETHGGFFGFGVQAELRGRLYKLFYVHVRGLVVGNAAPQSRDPIYRGLGGAGIGLGVYARRVFGRAEYLFVDTFGSGHFTRPFGSGAVGNDDWGRHAGLFSVGARIPVVPRTAVELWGGFMLGPKSVRTLPNSEPDRRILPTFLVGINVSYDIIPDRSFVEPPRRRRIAAP